MTQHAALLQRRRGGMLCHLTSLPGPPNHGVIGGDAIRFLDLLAEAGLSTWQLLPLSPPDQVGSPYHSSSLFAIDPNLVDWPALLGGRADLESLVKADAGSFDAFRARHAYWLEDFAVFTVAQATYRQPWWEWPRELRDHDARGLARFRRQHDHRIEAIIARQFIANRQWHVLRAEAARRDIVVIGDTPLYPAADSAEVWSHAEQFELDAERQMIHVAGVPPDYFSATGQLWGNPVYDWKRHQDTDFRWWTERIRNQLDLYDLLRIDHFLGLESYWKVPANALTAESGHWCKAPGHALLQRLASEFDPLPVIAEDLGSVTPEAEALRDAFSLPGMRVMQFGFSDDDDNPHVPESYIPNCVAYTGTHDNDTTLGWYRKLDAKTRANVDAAVGAHADMPWCLIERLFETSANTVIVPLQDFLALDSRARMNVPGETHGNWRWRFDWRQISADLPARIRKLVTATGRG